MWCIRKGKGKEADPLFQLEYPIANASGAELGLGVGVGMEVGRKCQEERGGKASFFLERTAWGDLAWESGSSHWLLHHNHLKMIRV